MATLTGRFDHSLDDKNRLFAPSRFREQLAAEGGHFTVAMGLDKCLYLFLPSQWESFRTQMETLKFESPKARRKYLAHFFENASPAPLDDQGRILIPQALKEHAGLKKEIVVRGAGSKAEIWDKAALVKEDKGTATEFRKIAETLDI